MKKTIFFLCILIISGSTVFGQIDKSLSFGELQSLTMDYARSSNFDSAIIIMEYAFKNFPEEYAQSTTLLGSLYTRIGEKSKAIEVWKAGLDKGYNYHLTHPSFQKYYNDDIEFEKLAEITRNKLDAYHLEHEVILPANYNSKNLYPVLFVFHGNGRNIEKSKKIWTSKIMTDEFISVFVQSPIYVNPTDFSWMPNHEKTEKEFKDLYDKIMKTYSVNSQQIVFSGMSAGGKKVLEYAFMDFIPMTGIVLNCPTIPANIKEDAIKQFVAEKRKMAIITGENDFALEAQEKLISDIEVLEGDCKIMINENLGHEFSQDFESQLNKYLKWIIKKNRS